MQHPDVGDGGRDDAEATRRSLSPSTEIFEEQVKSRPCLDDDTTTVCHHKRQSACRTVASRPSHPLPWPCPHLHSPSKTTPCNQPPGVRATIQALLATIVLAAVLYDLGSSCVQAAETNARHGALLTVCRSKSQSDIL